jgi:hypothetical protein
MTMRALMSVGLVALAATAGCGGATPKDAAPANTTQTATPAAATAQADPQIVKQGAEAYLKANDTESASGKALLTTMETGSPSAMESYALLRGKADASWAEALDTAAARALPKNPAGVLGLIDKGGKVSTLCTSPFIEPEAGVEKAYLDAAQAALSGLEATGELGKRRDECLQAIGTIAREAAKTP